MGAPVSPRETLRRPGPGTKELSLPFRVHESGGAIDEGEESTMTFTLKSAAFGHGETIPRKHTGDGEDLSPPLSWRAAPAGTKSFVLVCEDPDAPSGTFRHWALYNIPGNSSELPEGYGNSETSQSGVNDFGDYGYGGPSPPRGHGPHHYHFKLAALDVETIDPPRNAKVTDIWAIANKHLLGVAETVGVYER